MEQNPLRTVRIQNTGGVQSNIPFTFGHVFAVGHLQPSEGLKDLQVDVKTTHADGSVRHAILSGVLPSLKAGETASLQLTKAVPAKPGTPDSSALQQLEGLDAKILLTIAGEAYSASIKGNQFVNLSMWLSGPIVLEGQFSVPLKNAAGVEHPMLTARFGVRYYPGTKAARVEFIVENTKTFGEPARAFTYDVELQVAGKVAYAQKALRHYHHARWHRTAWSGAVPSIHIQHDIAYLIATKAVPNYDQTIPPSESVLAAMDGALSSANTGPMAIGTVTADMGMTGGRGDIGLLPDWSVNYLLTMDKRAKDVMLANADGSGSMSIHYRDEATGYPVRTDNDKNALISLHPNLNDRGPLPVPRFATPEDEAAAANVDFGHFPSLAYLPYLVTGELYYLEELQFWAAVCPLGTDPGYNGNGKGLLRWHQLRGQAWTMRTLAETAAITPDAHPLKAYFVQQLQNNFDFYTDTYVKGNPNKLGAYDGSGDGAFPVATGIAPWQDDFFTAAFGYLADLGFEQARPIAAWKAKFPVGRMVGEGYCSILAAPYALPFARDDKGAIYGSFADLYKANFYRDLVPTDDWQLRTDRKPAGVNFFDLPCGSQAQADFLGSINGFGWQRGRMVGYADSVLGYPANMQPALAAAVDLGVPGADVAWATFAARPVKPDYSKNPQWNIIPRKQSMPTTQPTTTAPVPTATTVPALQLIPAFTGIGTWAKVSDENGKVSVPAGSTVRYGAPGKGYVYATASGTTFTADNTTFKADPAANVVKQVDLFKPTAAPTRTFKVSPVTRYELTESVSDPAKGAGSIGTIGEFRTEADANRVKAALEKS